ncbi:LAETG motif-containing sortase-dependent surface protein [Streptomyces sp. NPDC014734]|uniref:LAETG motif-containing sortase-dependent surface protein n=1 Tax=Streptomyces sp. NPDC014734 TaxID=3364886 RepID=UPI0036F82AA1
MKLQRVLATAAVTAVIGPLALFVAPAAYAAGEPTADDVTASASSAPTTAPEPSTTADAEKADEDARLPAGQPTGEASPRSVADLAADRAATPSTEPSPTYTRPTFCSGIPDEDRGKTSLRGLPSTIVAGSGWHDFTYRVTNVSEIKVMETDITLYLGTADPGIDDVAQLDVTVEWFDTSTGKWKAIEGEGAGVFDNKDFATVKSLGPGEYADTGMRIKVGEKARAGTGYFFTTGYSYGEDDKCGFDGISQFDFTVLSPGSEPGKVKDAESKPGKADNVGYKGADGTRGGGNKPAAQGEGGTVPVSGALAETGSASALPTIAAFGGAALAMGAGAVFVVRRRKADSAV